MRRVNWPYAYLLSLLALVFSITDSQFVSMSDPFPPSPYHPYHHPPFSSSTGPPVHRRRWTTS